MRTKGWGGGRFRLEADAGTVRKTGAAPALDREAAALALLAGRAPVPALVAHGPGVLVTRRLPGAPRPLADLPPASLEALGRALAAVHTAASRATATGADPRAPRVWSAHDHARRRTADARDAAAAAGLPPPALPAPVSAVPFRPLHGDLTAGNVVWHGGRPALVDWEFWRWGDPAEDLAYLAEAGALPPGALAAVCRGHGDRRAAARIDGWRPLVALEAGAWWWRSGRPDLARPLLARAGVSPPSGPSAPTPGGPSGGPGGTPRPGRGRPG